jgi:hypothetical protein
MFPFLQWQWQNIFSFLIAFLHVMHHTLFMLEICFIMRLFNIKTPRKIPHKNSHFPLCHKYCEKKLWKSFLLRKIGFFLGLGDKFREVFWGFYWAFWILRKTWRSINHREDETLNKFLIQISTLNHRKVELNQHPISKAPNWLH